MEKMRNRLLSSILVLAMVISWLPGNFLQAEAAEATQLYGDSTNWPEWSGEAFPETGEYHYKLAGDVDLADIGVVSIPADATVAIDLCGNKIRAQAGSRSFSVEGTLIIQDSSEKQTGQVVGSDIDANGGNIYLKNGAVLDLYSGIITGGTAERGGNIYVNGGTFNMYGGTVSEGDSARGGNIYSVGTVRISGGEITGGTASWGGGNLFVNGMSNAIYISGGTVSGGSTKNGGICSQYGILDISGGAVEDDIYLTRQDNNYSKLCISGGTISGAITAAGVNYSGDSHVIEISGGKLTGTTYIKTAKTMTLSGAPEITNLTLDSGVLVTQVELSAGADITVDATGVFTTALENAEQQAQYFKTTEQSNFVEAVEGVLQIIVGCPCGCEKALETIDWQDWSGDDITESGHYRLLDIDTLGSTVTIDAGLDVVLDLYGNQLTAPTGKRSFEVSGRLSILDSVGGGQLVGKTVAGNGGNISLKKGAVLDLYSGTITGGIVSGGDTDYGGNIYIDGGTFNMYGGTVTGGTADRGGNIYLNKGTVRISDGEITGGTASWGGGNLFVTGMSNAIYISGGTVSGGSTKNGGICSRLGNLHISGGTVRDDIYITRSDGTNAALYISGGTISGAITATGVNYSGDSHVIEISGGNLTGTTYIKTAKTMILSGAPVIKNLTLDSGVLVTPVELSADADITIDATGVFTTALEDAESYKDIFKYSGSDKKYMVHNGALALFGIVASGECGNNLTWELTDTGVLIISGSGAMTDFYRLNNLVNNVPWDNNRAKFTSIVIESGVTSIGDNAFYDCYNLKSITIADTVTDVGNYAFYGCTDLTEIVLPDDLTSLGDNAFYNCSSLKRIVIPDGITTIGSNTFRGCTGLTEVTLPASVTSIGTYAFDGCSSLKSIVIPDGITTIGSNTFRNCTGLTEVTLPASVTSIGANAFNGSALTNVYYMGEVADWATISGLNNNTILTDLAAAGHVHYRYVTGGGMTGSEVHWKLTEDFILTIFGEGAMSNYYYDTAKTAFLGTPWQQHADQITTVKIESGVTSVGDWAFYGLPKLESVTLADSVTRIGNHAFRGCTALTEINLASVEVIGRNAFQGCTGLTAVNCTSAETLGAYAFYGCTGLTAFTVPKTMAAIGEHAFDGCAALQTVTLVSGTTSIGSNAFANCGNLTAIIVPTDNDSFASDTGALYNKDKTTLVQVPGGITGRFTVPEGVTTIGAGAFAGCDKLTEVILPATVKELAAAVFDGCGNLTAINVSENNKKFASDEAGALYNKDMTTLVQVPGGMAGIYSVADTVTTVGQSAFAGNKGITEVTLPSSVTTVEKWAFSCSENLAKITLPSDVPSILVGAFEHTGLTDVYYQGNNLKWEDETVESYNEPLLNATVRCLLVAEGTSNDIAWVLTDEGVLIFTGNGALEDYTAENMPWYSYREMITQVVFGEGITYVGSNILNGCTILTEVTIPVTVKDIGDNAFAGCEALTDVYYSGSLARWNDLHVGHVGEGNEQLGVAEIHCDFVEPESIKVQTPAAKTEYYLNEELDITGLTLTVLYGDGFTQQITEGYEVSYDFTLPGTQTVTVTYQQVQTTYEVTVIPGGSCGEDLNWLFEETTGILTVTGTGAMTDYDAETPAPWSIFAAQITALVLDKGITAIGANAFSSSIGLQEVTYGGTAKQWEAVTKAGGNEPLSAAKLTCAVLPGDADNSGRVDTGDVVYILQLLADWDVTINLEAANVDGDDRVTTGDVVYILQFLAGWDVTLG